MTDSRSLVFTDGDQIVIYQGDTQTLKDKMIDYIEVGLHTRKRIALTDQEKEVIDLTGVYQIGESRWQLVKNSKLL